MNPHLDLLALLPEIVLCGVLVLVLVADLVLPGRTQLPVVLGAAGTAAGLGAVLVLWRSGGDHVLLDGSFRVDGFAAALKGGVCAATAAVLVMGVPARWRAEYVLLMVSSALGACVLASARDLLTFFVAFELLAIPGYLLVGWEKGRKEGHEAVVKYFVLGVVASALMLYGISLLFGLAGGTRFDQVAAVVGRGDGMELVGVSVVMVLVGMAFKLSAVPFHSWAPDAYQGAPVPVAAFLSTVSKAAAAAALTELVLVALPAADEVWAPLLAVLAVLTMTVGNLVALRQRDLVRLLAYSSVAQAGYLLVPLAVTGYYGGTVALGTSSVIEFLVVYVLTNVGAFAAATTVLAVQGTTALASLDGLFRRRPALAAAIAATMLSLAGMPPFGGWFAKLVVFRAGVEAATPVSVCLVVVAAVNSAIGLVYYAQVVRRLWLDVLPADDGAMTVVAPRSATAVLLASVVAVVAVGVLPGLVTYVGDLSSLVS